MVKTTVYLPQELKEKLERAARVQGVSEAELVRAAIEKLVGTGPRRRPKIRYSTAGSPGLAERVDEALAGFGE